MALVFNATNETVHTVVFGNHFTLKPKQVKNFQDKISHFMVNDRRYLGLVDLPTEFDDPSYKETAEGKATYAAKEQEGIDNYIKHLRSIIYNNQVALKGDLEKANIKADPRAFASDGEIAAMETLVKYQKSQEDDLQKKVERIKELERRLQGK